jgi:protein-S-isoprenylcysteine O-methyltransferase Ste14
VALTAVAALLALQHTIALVDQEVGIGSWIPQLIYVAGVAVAFVGAVLGAMASMARPAAASGPRDTAG